MKVYVVMENDFPDSVWEDEAEADEYIKKRREETPKDGPPRRRIYWRAYEFELHERKEK